MEMSTQKKTALVILGLGAVGAAIFMATSDANASTLPEGDGSDPYDPYAYGKGGDLPSGPTPGYSMPSDDSAYYDGNNYASSSQSPSTSSPSSAYGGQSQTDYPNTYQELPGGSTSASTPRGDPTVQHYQQQLYNIGYDPGPIDGRNGPLTRRAVMDYQRDSGLAVDGILGPRTKASIDGYTGQAAPVSGLPGAGTRRKFWRAAQGGAPRTSMAPSPTSGLGGPCRRWRV